MSHGHFPQLCDIPGVRVIKSFVLIYLIQLVLKTPSLTQLPVVITDHCYNNKQLPPKLLAEFVTKSGPDVCDKDAVVLFLHESRIPAT